MIISFLAGILLGIIFGFLLHSLFIYMIFKDKIKRRKVVGYMTKFPSLEYLDKIANGKLTQKEINSITAKDLKPIRTPIYSDEIKL